MTNEQYPAEPVIVGKPLGEGLLGSADATPRFRKVYLECLDDTGAITRLEPLYAFAERMERENQDLRQQMVGLRREIQHQKNRVEAYAAQPNKD